jgi:hypothetical protein
MKMFLFVLLFSGNWFIKKLLNKHSHALFCLHRNWNQSFWIRLFMFANNKWVDIPRRWHHFIFEVFHSFKLILSHFVAFRTAGKNRAISSQVSPIFQIELQ